MADINYMHFADLINAAMPYVDNKTKITINLISTLFTFMDSFQNFRQPPDLTACDYEDTKINVEGLLTAIKPICDEKERPFVDQILGIFNAKRMFEAYNTYMNIMKSMGGFDDSPFQNTEAAYDTDAKNTSDDTSSGFDLNSLFANLYSHNKVDNDTFGTQKPNENPDIHTNAQNIVNGETNKHNADNDISDMDNSFSGYSDNDSDSVTTNILNSTDISIPHTSNSIIQNKMMEMIKSIIPPEQMNTFENLSMLFNTMSYDSNNKDDQT
jgi:hypothetical protein